MPNDMQVRPLERGKTYMRANLELTLPVTAETAPSRRAAVISFIAVGLGWSLFWFCVRESGFDLPPLSLNYELVRCTKSFS